LGWRGNGLWVYGLYQFAPNLLQTRNYDAIHPCNSPVQRNNRLRMQMRRIGLESKDEAQVKEARVPRSLSLDGFQNSDWFELIVEGVPVALLMADQEQRISLVNRNTEALFGYSRAELIGERLELLVPQRYRPQHAAHVSTYLEAPTQRRMGAGRELFGRRKNATEMPIEIGLNPIRTAQGVFTLASIIDITERNRAAAVAGQMAALVESADDAIVAKTLDGIIRSWNPGAERLLGYSAKEIIGQPVTRLLPHDHLDEEAMILGRVVRGERVEQFETLRRRSDGSLVEVSLTISPIRDGSGAIVGASKIMRDITKRKRSEQELRRSNAELAQKNTELDNFVYTASHDLRSPLLGISSIVQWILEDDRALAEESRGRLGLILGRIERMKQLLTDIRDYARTEGKGVPSGTPVSAATLAANVAATAHVPPGFSIRVDPSLESVQVARVPLEQVLHNLIDNAIKHHDRPAGTVTIAVQAQAPWLRFSVIDDGPGIPEEYRESIFEMFKTLKPRDEVEGSGMGLALVRKIVGRMGGRCGVDAAAKRGSHFWFEWPTNRAVPSGEN
jgi:PAS domain S-box-containing protein